LLRIFNNLKPLFPEPNLWYKSPHEDDTAEKALSFFNRQGAAKTIEYTEIKRLTLICAIDEITRWRFLSAKRALTRLLREKSIDQRMPSGPEHGPNFSF